MHNIEVHAVKFAGPIENTTFTQLGLFCSRKNAARIFHFQNWEDAHRTLLGELLLKAVLAKKTGCFPHEINIEPDQWGKPVAPDFPDLYFNLSHSGAWVVSAWDSDPIGIDIEKIIPLEEDRYPEIPFPLDFGQDQGLAGNHKIQLFFSRWTLLESMAKKTGRGLGPTLSRLTPDWLKRIPLNDDFCSFSDGFHNFCLYPLDPGYRMAVCAKEDRFPIRLTLYPIEDLIKFYRGNGK